MTAITPLTMTPGFLRPQGSLWGLSGGQGGTGTPAPTSFAPPPKAGDGGGGEPDGWTGWSPPPTLSNLWEHAPLAPKVSAGHWSVGIPSTGRDEFLRREGRSEEWDFEVEGGDADLGHHPKRTSCSNSCDCEPCSSSEVACAPPLGACVGRCLCSTGLATPDRDGEGAAVGTRGGFVASMFRPPVPWWDPPLGPVLPPIEPPTSPPATTSSPPSGTSSPGVAPTTASVGGWLRVARAIFDVVDFFTGTPLQGDCTCKFRIALQNSLPPGYGVHTMPYTFSVRMSGLCRDDNDDSCERPCKGLASRLEAMLSGMPSDQQAQALHAELSRIHAEPDANVFPDPRRSKLSADRLVKFKLVDWEC